MRCKSWKILVLLIYLLHLADNAKSEKPPRFKQTFTNFSAVVEQEIKLICQVLAPKDTQYWWLKDGKSIDATKMKFRYKQFRYMKIKNVKKTDAGEYTCVASNKAGKIEHTMHLYVLDAKPTEIQDSKPWFTRPEKMRNELLSFPAGNTAKLICDANGNPEPTVAWYKDDKRFMEVQKEPIDPYQFTLNLRSLIPADAGVYMCNVSNQWGYINKTYKLKVEARLISIPIVQEIDNVTAYEGDNVTVICKAYSDAFPHFQWLIFTKDKNLTVLRPNLRKDEYLFPSTGKRLHGVKLFLPNVSFEDQKEYTCMAGNYIGFRHESFFLRVLPRIYTSVSQSTVAAATSKDDFCRAVYIIVPVVALVVLVVVVLVMWLFSMRRKRHQADVDLRYTVDDVANGEMLLTEAKKTPC